MDYPTAPRADLIETLPGVAVLDPFRRLESADDPETIAWVEEQADLDTFLFHYLTRTSASEQLRR